jgi:hypothetical protein
MADTYTFLASKNCYMLEDEVTPTNHGNTILHVHVNHTDGGNNYEGNSLVSFDTSSLQGVTITSATLKLYCYSSDTARTYNVRKCTRNDWEEMQATWNIYKTSNNWSTAGGDNVTTAPNQSSFDPVVGLMSCTVTDIVQDALTSGILSNFYICDSNQTTPHNVTYTNLFYGRNHASLYPYLEVVVTPVDKTGVTEHSLAFASSSVSLEQTTYAYNTANNNQAYILNLRTNAWSFQDDCPFSNAIYRPSTQKIIGARRDTGNIATLDSGTTFDGDTITWTVQTGFYNFGQLDEIKGMPDEASQALKRLKAMFTEVRATGNITLTVYTEQDATGKSFTITPTTTDNVVYNMVRTTLSRDIRGKYVSFKMSASVPAWVGETGVKVQARELK